MTASAAAAPVSHRTFKPSFFFWMTLAMAFFVFGGFGLHSALPALLGRFPPAPPVVHLHAVIMIAWMVLLVVQSGLVGAGNLKLHRSLGTWGIAHATLVLVTGLAIQLIASRAGMDAGRDPGTDGLYLGLLAALGFGILFTLAIRNTRRPEIHKRMILFAMLPVLPPGVNRFWFNALGLEDPIPTFWLYLTLWSMASAILVQERRATGRISGYSGFGAGWIFVEGVVHEAVVGSAWFEQVAAGILGMVHYR
ncbi:MAG: hypothetical protein B7Z08_01740 [Sphingomonadales bacterium 32-68-7]|nr:MAG: hypothetical protein B7Z33_07935 [Sphingomonadales bacterium 12-68-11]OYX10217.1 MAG: hypothetical protein B7Z08_01740 [Sphingomonadales bacterium 32-68-7]